MNFYFSVSPRKKNPAVKQKKRILLSKLEKNVYSLFKITQNQKKINIISKPATEKYRKNIIKHQVQTGQ